MTDSVAKQVLNVIVARLQTILVANGYNTNAGQNVFKWRPSIDVTGDNLPAVRVFAVEDFPADNAHDERMVLALHFTIEGAAAIGASNAVDVAEDLVADIKKAALVLADRNLGGLCADLRYRGREVEPPEDGSSIVSVRVNLEATYPEIYGDPYTVI